LGVDTDAAGNQPVKLGVVFPQMEFGPDPEMVRRYAQHVELAGYDYIAAYDHVLGASPDRPMWSGPYTIEDPFHEVMVLFGYIAAVTTRIELATEILVLPQRQTALVAKQAAEIDLLSGGRLRLGVGLGWNWVEYEALGMDFHNRGKRIEEQIQLMRELWSKREVTFTGANHQVSAAGLRPMPGNLIPVWIGATADVGLRRAARVADGWQSELGFGPEAEENVRKVRSYVRDAGRDPASFGIAAEVGLAPAKFEESIREVRAWTAIGATHVSMTTMGQGIPGPTEHIELLIAFKQAWDAASPGALR
jgi:probable F420-dependent oxidoreductase